MEISYRGIKATINKTDLIGDHILNKDYGFEKRGTYKDGDIIKIYLGKDDQTKISMRLFNINDDLKITFIR